MHPAVHDNAGGGAGTVPAGDTELPPVALELGQMVRAVARFVPLERAVLPDEFFPAHLTVALIDAVFRSGPEEGSGAPPCTERYCRRFGIEAVRADRWEFPPVDVQDTLGDLVGRYDEIGTERMANDVFGDRRCFPGTKMSRAGCILAAATALRSIGIEVLQEMATGSPEEIDHLLRHSVGLDASTTRMFLMCSGEDDFVRGDAIVLTFVANALGRESVSAADAIALVRQAAHELLVSPRFLDREIWKFGASFASAE